MKEKNRHKRKKEKKKKQNEFSALVCRVNIAVFILGIQRRHKANTRIFWILKEQPFCLS